MTPITRRRPRGASSTLSPWHSAPISSPPPGALIPTLLFGIPGSGTAAVLLGGFILFGLQPGPRMVTENIDVSLLIIWCLALANVVGAVACLLLSRPIALLSLVPAARLVPFCWSS